MRSVLLESPPLDAYHQMALDETLLELCGIDAMTLRLFDWSAPAVTFGYFQAYDEVRQEASQRGAQGPLVRRMTGGGIVYHDGDVTFSFVFPWADGIGASWIYKEVHRGIHLGLKSRGIRSRLWSPPDKEDPASAAACFTRPSPMDLVREDGAKFLGGALRRRAGAGLYQGSLRPEGFQSDRERLVEAIVEGVGQAWNTSFQPGGLEEGILLEARELAQAKYKSDEWIKRR